MEFPATGVQQVPLHAVISGEGLDFDFIVDEDTFVENTNIDGIAVVSVKLADGVSVADARPALERALRDFPTVELRDIDQQRADIETQVNQLLGLLTGLLALSVIIALFGIVNTLGL